MIIRIPSLKNVHKFVFSSCQASPSLLSLELLYATPLLYLLFLLVDVQSWLTIQEIYFFAVFLFHFSSGNNIHKATLWNLLYEICYLLHQIMVLLCLFIPTACMLYISLPMLLAVKCFLFSICSFRLSQFSLHCFW